MKKNKIQLDGEEIQILQDFEEGKFESIQNFHNEKRKLEDAASNTLQKDKRINIRISSRDLEKIQARAAKEGMPYKPILPARAEQKGRNQMMYPRWAHSLPIILLVLFCSVSGIAQKRLPILDMHMHARTASHYGPPPQPMCAEVLSMPVWDQTKKFGDSFGADPNPPPCKLLMSPATDEKLLQQTLAVMKRFKITGVLGGYDPKLVDKWVSAAPGRFIPGLDFRLDKATGTASSAQATGPFKPITPDEIRSLHASGKLKVFAEITNQFGGISPDDPRMEPYWSLAEELDIPVGIHLGPGGPGEPYLGNPNYRARLQSALTLEETLVRHPKLRVYIMHAGYPFLDDLLALLFTHPQVYVEVSILANVEPRAGFYRFLKGIIDGGYGNRVMFGSDQMAWPGLIEPAIRSIEQAPFLTAKQKRDIFYSNAARFLRLSKQEMAQHHRPNTAL